jgi:ubiquitin C-terminal hydrolase
MKQSGVIRFDNPIFVNGVTLLLSTKRYSVPTPFGIVVRADPPPPEPTTFTASFIWRDLSWRHEHKTVSRQITLRKTCPSDTVYFPMLIEKVDESLRYALADAAVVEIQYSITVQNEQPSVASTESVVADPTKVPSAAEESRVEKKPIAPPKTPRVRSSPRSGRAMVGLENQGATCYMNSVLQSLFHLPRFRQIVYRMPTETVDCRETSIPLNLQALFYNLQTRSEACPTRDLTVSFGWGLLEGFEQHDIQEFLRVLLTNIEEKLKPTEDKEAIARLMRGHTRREISNRHRGFRQEVSEEFYDLSLQVKDCRSVEESLARFVRSERLTGENQYDTGDGKIDVEVKTQISELPPVLALHLERFEFDLRLSSQEKINDRFEFGDRLDMQPYICDGDFPCTRYALFAVLVHSGSARFGHYYVYLRPNDGSEWYEFNDSLVVSVTSDRAIKTNFGGNGSATYSNISSKYGSRTFSAYMLIYVREDKRQEVFVECDQDIPDHIRTYANERWATSSSVTRYGTSQITVCTEEALKRNARDGAVGFWRSDAKLSLALADDTTLDEFYVLAATEMQREVEDVRLWGLKTVSSELESIVPRGGRTVGALWPKRFLAQRKDRTEALEPRDKIVLFMKWYTQTTRGIVYAGTVTVSPKDEVRTLFPQLRKQMMLPREEPLTIVLETELAYSGRRALDRVYEFLSWADSGCKNGSAIIVQPLQPLENGTVNEMAAPDDDAIRTFFPALPPTVDGYLSAIDGLNDVQLYAFETLAPAFRIRIPRMQVADLAEFLLRTGIQCDRAAQTLLLFETRKNKILPATTPLSGHLPANPKALFYLVVPSESSSGRQAVIVDISEDGYRPLRCKALFVRRDCNAKAIIEAVFGSTDDRAIRVLLIQGHQIARTFQPTDPLILSDTANQSIRLEVVPDDQLGAPPNELRQVVQVDIDHINYFKPAGFPFLLRWLGHATLGNVQEMIKERLRLSDDVIARYQFVAFDSSDRISYQKYEPSKMLKKEQRMDDVIKNDQYRLLMVRPGVRGTGPRTTSIVIKN